MEYVEGTFGCSAVKQNGCNVGFKVTSKEICLAIGEYHLTVMDVIRELFSNVFIDSHVVYETFTQF